MGEPPDPSLKRHHDDRGVLPSRQVGDHFNYIVNRPAGAIDALAAFDRTPARAVDAALAAGRRDVAEKALALEVLEYTRVTRVERRNREHATVERRPSRALDGESKCATRAHARTTDARTRKNRRA